MSRIIRLPKGDGTARGHFQGETFRGLIKELAELRTDLCLSQAKFTSREQVQDIAKHHLGILKDADLDLFNELCGIADGAALNPADIVILNHYTDLKDLDPEQADILPENQKANSDRQSSDENCTALFADTEADGPTLAQTWDMHGSAAPYVAFLNVPEHVDHLGNLVPEQWLLSLVGCLGMTGLSQKGIGVTINNLRSSDARVGLVWSALVRKVLKANDAASGRNVILSSRLGSGHHYVVADKEAAYAMETSGKRYDVWRTWRRGDDAHPWFHHENHCVGSYVSLVSSISPISTTLAREAFMNQQAAPKTHGEVWAMLGSHEGFPRGICTHLADAQNPHAMLTCGAVMMDLENVKFMGREGCIHQQAPEHFAWSK